MKKEIAEMLRCNLKTKTAAPPGCLVTLPVASANIVHVSHTAQMTAIISIPLKQVQYTGSPRNVTVVELLPPGALAGPLAPHHYSVAILHSHWLSVLSF